MVLDVERIPERLLEYQQNESRLRLPSEQGPTPTPPVAAAAGDGEAALRDAAGLVRGFVKIMRDLTDRKRTQEELQEQMEELTRFNEAAVGRELRMIELKKEVNELCVRAGEDPRYDLDYDEPAGESS